MEYHTSLFTFLGNDDEYASEASTLEWPPMAAPEAFTITGDSPVRMTGKKVDYHNGEIMSCSYKSACGRFSAVIFND